MGAVDSDKYTILLQDKFNYGRKKFLLSNISLTRL
jgi:hypothetical protein